MADESFEVELRINLAAGNLSGQLAGELGRIKGAYTGADAEINKMQRSLTGATNAQAGFAKNLSTTRYALYDVASSFGVISLGALGLVAASSAVAIAWERDFANVARTTNATGEELNKIRDDLIDLSQTLPVAFADVAKIATLGNQLGIAQTGLVQFTETVIKFSAATGISAEQSAMAFGRLGNILGVAATEYDELGSSIVKVGIATAATEAEIIAVAQQIGPIARLAGSSADEVIGLSAAFASVKIPPELARSVITKTFTDINRAIAEGGPKLDAFGAALGRSGQQFADAWRTDATGTFVQFLQAIPQDGVAATQMLDGLGLASQRNTPGLQKMAQNIDLVKQALRDAGVGFDEGTELNRQYGIIAETTAAKLQVLSNNFQAFLAAVGGATTGPLKALADGLSGLLKMATNLSSSFGGQLLSGVVLGFTALLGVITALGAATAVGFAGIIAMQQALAGLSTSVGASNIGLSGLIAQLAALGGAGKAAAVGINATLFALKGLAAAAGLALTVPLAAWLSDVSFAMKGLDTDLDQQIVKFEEAFSKAPRMGVNDMRALSTEMTQFGRSIAFADDTGFKLVKNIDETLASMIASGHVAEAREQFLQLREVYTKHDTLDDFNALFVDTREALTQAGQAAATAGPSLGAATAPLTDIEQAANDAAAALQELSDILMGIGSTSIGQEQALIGQAAALEQMAEAAQVAGASIHGTDAASRGLRSAFVEVETSSRAAAQAIIDNGGEVGHATEVYNAGRSAIVEIGKQMGMNEGEAQAWADTTYGSAAEAQAAIARYSEESKRVPELEVTTLQNNAPQAGESIRGYINRVDSIPGYKRTLIETEYRSIYTVINRGGAGAGPGMQYYGSYATGGSIFGPGTKTSDSVPILASAGEFMMRAAAVDKYGMAFMRAINEGKLPRFAGGGAVGGDSTGFSGVIELGPKSLGRMGNGEAVTVNVMLDDVALSKAVQRGDQKRRIGGDFHA